jgi:hypothetical protein
LFVAPDNQMLFCDARAKENQQMYLLHCKNVYSNKHGTNRLEPHLAKSIVSRLEGEQSEHRIFSSQKQSEIILVVPYKAQYT